MNAVSLIAGNGLSLLGMVLESISATRKTARSMLLIQSVSQFVYCISTIFFKGYSAAVQNGVNVLRNLAVLRNIESRFVEWFLIALGVILGILWNNLGLVGYLPIVANLQYTLAVFRFKEDERSLKKSFFLSLIMFAVFNVFIFNVVGVVSNLIILTTTGISLLRGAKKQ